MPWWLTPPRAEQPLVTKWRFHLEASGALSKTTGNLEGYTRGTTTTVYARKGIVTNVLLLKDSAQSFALPAYHTSFVQKTNSITDLLMINVSGNTSLLAGYFRERDDPKLIKHRKDIFAGVGQTVLNRPKHKLLVIGALGHEDEAFVVPGFEDNGAIAYGSWSYAWTATQTLGLRHTFEITDSLGTTADYRTTITGAADVTVVNHLYLSPSIEYRYDNRTTPLARHADTSLLMSFRVVY